MRASLVAILAGASLFTVGCGVGVDDPEGWDAAHADSFVERQWVAVPVGVTSQGPVMLWTLVEPLTAADPNGKGQPPATSMSPTKGGGSVALPQDPQPWDAPKTNNVDPPDDGTAGGSGMYGPGPK